MNLTIRKALLVGTLFFMLIGGVSHLIFWMLINGIATGISSIDLSFGQLFFDFSIVVFLVISVGLIILFAQVLGIWFSKYDWLTHHHFLKKFFWYGLIGLYMGAGIVFMLTEEGVEAYSMLQRNYFWLSVAYTLILCTISLAFPLIFYIPSMRSAIWDSLRKEKQSKLEE